MQIIRSGPERGEVCVALPNYSGRVLTHARPSDPHAVGKIRRRRHYDRIMSLSAVPLSRASAMGTRGGSVYTRAVSRRKPRQVKRRGPPRYGMTPAPLPPLPPAAPIAPPIPAVELGPWRRFSEQRPPRGSWFVVFTPDGFAFVAEDVTLPIDGEAASTWMVGTQRECVERWDETDGCMHEILWFPIAAPPSGAW